MEVRTQWNEMGFSCYSALPDWSFLSKSLFYPPGIFAAPCQAGWHGQEQDRDGVLGPRCCWKEPQISGPHCHLAQGPHTSHSKARGSRWRGNPLPAGSESSPTHSSETCDTCLQALCCGWGRDVACQAVWMLPLKWLFLLSFDVHSGLNCIFNWHKQADIFSIRNA